MFILHYSDACRETNLKFRQALTITHNELKADQAEKDLAAFNGIKPFEQNYSKLYIVSCTVLCLLIKGAV